MLKLALRLMRNSVRRKAGCDITTVSPLDVVARAVIPAMFGHGEEDSFISLQHSGRLALSAGHFGTGLATAVAALTSMRGACVVVCLSTYCSRLVPLHLLCE